MNWDIIGSNKGFSSVQHRATACNNGGIANWTVWVKLLWNLNTNTCLFLSFYKIIWKGLQRNGGYFVPTLTHWGRVTHICVSQLTIIGSDNCLSPGWRQAIIWTNAGILLIRTLGTNFSEILGKILSFSFKKMHLKMSSAKMRLFSPGLNELTPIWRSVILRRGTVVV